MGARKARMVVKKPWRTRTMRRFFLVRVQVWRINAMMLNSDRRSAAPWSAFKLPRDRSRFGHKVHATSGWDWGIRSVARKGRESRRRGVIKAGPPLKSCRDENSKRRPKVRLYRNEWDPQRPVKNTGRGGKKKKKSRRRATRRKRNTRVGIGNALRTDIAPSNVAHVGPGGNSASARQEAAAILFCPHLVGQCQ